MAVVAGIDWASETHVCCVIDDAGGVVERFDVTHDASSLRAMTKRLVRLGVSGVAIERGDGPVVEELMDAELAVFVVPSRQVKGLRSRYGSAGNKDDRFNTYVLADTLRTDGHRWKRLLEDRGGPAIRSPAAVADLCVFGVAGPVRCKGVGRGGPGVASLLPEFARILIAPANSGRERAPRADG